MGGLVEAFSCQHLNKVIFQLGKQCLLIKMDKSAFIFFEVISGRVPLMILCKCGSRLSPSSK